MQRTLIYENNLTGDQAGWECESVKDGLLEGTGIGTRSDCLSLRSENFAVPRIRTATSISGCAVSSAPAWPSPSISAPSSLVTRAWRPSCTSSRWRV